MKKLVVLSGAGISAESGINTFRDSNGLWENHDVMEVASIEGWHKNPKLVLEFYNARRKNACEAQPNNAHIKIAKLEDHFDVHIVTQNVDDLHERGGSSKITHLHGELTKAKDVYNSNCIIDIGSKDIHLGDLSPEGNQLRPFIVWFGEDVPKMTEAIDIVSDADIVLVIGTSMNVYPAAGLINYAPDHCKLYLIDPNPIHIPHLKVRQYLNTATEGIELFINDINN